MIISNNLASAFEINTYTHNFFNIRSSNFNILG